MKKSKENINKKIKRKIKNEKGISLITLGITIIVLLIIATITMKQMTETELFNELQESQDEIEQKLNEGQADLDELKEEYEQL